MVTAEELKERYGYTTRCDVCGRFTWYEIEQQCCCDYPETTTCKTCGHSEEDYENMIRCTGTLRKI